MPAWHICSPKHTGCRFNPRSAQNTYLAGSTSITLCTQNALLLLLLIQVHAASCACMLLDDWTQGRQIASPAASTCPVAHDCLPPKHIWRLSAQRADGAVISTACQRYCGVVHSCCCTHVGVRPYCWYACTCACAHDAHELPHSLTGAFCMCTAFCQAVGVMLLLSKIM
jgi:hypothetical protein